MMIKVILSIGIVLIVYYVLSRNKTLKINNVFIAVAGICSIVVVCFPDITTIAANILGVHRGVDLVFYIAFLSTFFLLVKCYKKIRVLEKKLTELIRQQTLNNIND